MYNKVFISPPKSLSRSFTLIELIVVIIIVGILAAVGISQYSLIVEKGRTAEAKVRIGTMRQLAYQYYLENKDMTNIQDADVGVDYTCYSTDFYKYHTSPSSSSGVHLYAYRCTVDGKTPNVSRMYRYELWFFPAGQSDWHCRYLDDNSSCFGLTP
ncbi:MAG: prepilin-type N-terminal cleavage/methylation domain-containing protein [Candidatus Omnitrophota bacterium]